MNTKIWFILNDGQVTGPFEPAEVESKISQLKTPQIWGRGSSEWMTPTKWRQSLSSNNVSLSKNTEPPQQWKMRIEGKEEPAMSYTNLIKRLKELRDFSVIDVCPENSTQWREVFSVPQIVEQLGITRRAHPRVPIVGTFQATNDLNEEFKFRVISISEGGLGVTEAGKSLIGSKYKGTITSPNLFMPIDANCEVVYAGKDGYAGLRFIGLPEEFKNSIIEYVNKFATT